MKFKLLKQLFFYSVIIIVLYASAIYIFNNISYKSAEFSLDYLRVLIWPIIVLIFIFKFKNNLSRLIDRVQGINIPFGEIQATHSTAINQNYKKINDSLPNTNSNLNKLIKNREEAIKNLKNERKALIDKLLMAQLYLEFERIYNAIFASQIDLLIKLKHYKKLTLVDVNQHFLKVKRVYSQVFSTWTLKTYLEFLFSTQLILMNVNENYIEITPKGKAFIEYLTLMNYKKFGI